MLRIAAFHPFVSAVRLGGLRGEGPRPSWQKSERRAGRAERRVRHDLTNDKLEAARTRNWFLETDLVIARLDKAVARRGRAAEAAGARCRLGPGRMRRGAQAVGDVLRRRGQVHEALPPRAAPVGPDPSKSGILNALRNGERSLKSQLVAIQRAIEAIEGDVPPAAGRGRKKAAKAVGRRKRAMSDEQRRAVAERMRKYWAARREAKAQEEAAQE